MCSKDKGFYLICNNLRWTWRSYRKPTFVLLTSPASGNNWVGQVYHSKFNAKARGTAIIINKAIPFESQEVIGDPNGRYIIVVGELFANLVILVNVYAPKCHDSQFFEKLFLAIPKLDSGLLIVGGDFNLVLDVTMDRSSSTPPASYESSWGCA